MEYVCSQAFGSKAIIFLSVRTSFQPSPEVDLCHIKQEEDEAGLELVKQDEVSSVIVCIFVINIGFVKSPLVYRETN